MTQIETISREMNIAPSRVEPVLRLLEDGAGIPFIARYRKEMTGSMDEVGIRQIRDLAAQYRVLSDRKIAITASLKERDLYTDALAKKIENAETLSQLEDLYEKYRPKKKTRADLAKESGLKPLAEFLLDQSGRDPVVEAGKYIQPGKQVPDGDTALAGARDIIAETINGDTGVRAAMRDFFSKTAMLVSTVKKSKRETGAKYKDYYDWREPAFKAPSHRVMAMLRGKKEGILRVRVLPDEAAACRLIEKRYVKNHTASAAHVRRAVKDGYSRLLSKSMETECLKQLKVSADTKALGIFSKNLTALLLAPPLGAKRILAIDPGFRTGCKAVCLNRQGKLLDHTVIFPHDSREKAAVKTICRLAETYQIEAVAVGNGTAGRETMGFVRNIRFKQQIPVVMVDESGASIYSASDAAREEFPDHDITVRGAVSIGRRLMDPLAELVKLDPKSIGVGQYQHDVDPKRLRTALDDVVISCVNKVGVEVNTASKELLARVAGLNGTTAKNIVQYRDENGPFKDRNTLQNVPRLGPKAFEQAAGFLRIQGAAMPLDNSGVHPESYGIVMAMASDMGMAVDRLIRNEQVLAGIDLKRYVTDRVGMPTLEDIKKELLNPGRDPRPAFENIAFDDTVHEISDLRPGMVLNGVVTNVTAFGAFVDIGVHQDGLVHISQMANRFVRDPSEIVSVRQAVRVTVLEVDTGRRRIALSMKQGGS